MRQCAETIERFFDWLNGNEQNINVFPFARKSMPRSIVQWCEAVTSSPRQPKRSTDATTTVHHHGVAFNRHQPYLAFIAYWSRGKVRGKSGMVPP
jgi:hypothetical protein